MKAWTFTGNEPCNRCGSPIVRYTQATRMTKRKQKYEHKPFYEWWFRCPNCGAMFMPEEAKRYITCRGK